MLPTFFLLFIHNFSLLGFNIYDPTDYPLNSTLSGPIDALPEDWAYDEMIDEISYSVPFGIIGQIVNSIFIKRDLLDIFEYRKKVIDKYFKENK